MRVVLKSPKGEFEKSYGNATKQMKLGTHETNDKRAHNSNNTNNTHSKEQLYKISHNCNTIHNN